MQSTTTHNGAEMSTITELEKSEQTTVANQVNEIETSTEAEIVSSTTNTTIATEDLQMSTNALSDEAEVSEADTAETAETGIDTTSNSVEVTIVESTEEDGLAKGKSLVVANPASNALIIENNKLIKHARGNTLMKEVEEYLGFEDAERITNAMLLSGKLDAWMRVEKIDGGEDRVGRLVLNNTSTMIIDPIEPEDATGVLSHNNYFDAVYKTTARGGEEYPVIFDVQAIISMIKQIDSTTINKTILLLSLAQNIAISELSSCDISKVIQTLVAEQYLEDFNTFRDAIKKAKWRYKRFNNAPSEQEMEALYRLKDYAVLDDKGTIKLIDTAADSYTTYTKANLRLMFDNQKIEVLNERTGNVKMINPVDIYLESKYRREYKGVTFDPSNKADPTLYNIFKGFKFGQGSSQARIHGFKEFVKAVICSANEQRFMIVWSFFAQIFQKPHVKMGTALILLSREGAGKGTFMRVMGKLMGDFYMSSTDHKHIVSPFNKHLERVLLFYANEAKFTDNSLTVNKLKNIITEVDATSEIKGGDTYSISNYTHLVIDGNDGTPVEQTADSRRFNIVHVDESKIGDHDYWAEVNREIETEGFYEALMQDLMSFDYSEWEHFLRVPPKPELSDEQIQESFDAIVAWWTACLVDGRVPYVEYDLTSDDKLNILNENMFISFKKWCSVHGHKSGFNSSTFGKAFREQALGVDSNLDSKGKITINGDRKHSHVYAQISLCRESFSSRKQLNNMDYNGSEWKLPMVG